MEVLPTITIDRGENVSRTIIISDVNGPINFTGWTSRVRVTDTHTGKTIYDFPATLNATGEVLIIFTNTDRFPINSKPGGAFRYICEIKLTQPSGVVGRVLQCMVKVNTTL